jgi:hypothetical protein
MIVEPSVVYGRVPVIPNRDRWRVRQCGQFALIADAGKVGRPVSQEPRLFPEPGRSTFHAKFAPAAFA